MGWSGPQVSGVSSHHTRNHVVATPGSLYDPISAGSSRRSSQQSACASAATPRPQDLYSTSNLVLQVTESTRDIQIVFESLV